MAAQKVNVDVAVPSQRESQRTTICSLSEFHVFKLVPLISEIPSMPRSRRAPTSLTRCLGPTCFHSDLAWTHKQDSKTKSNSVQCGEVFIRGQQAGCAMTLEAVWNSFTSAALLFTRPCNTIPPAMSHLGSS